MTSFDYSKHAIELFSRYDFIKAIDILLLDEPVAKIKAVITKKTFINIFYNADTLKYSFALIKNGKRIFGADNSRKWHVHPFDNPDSHKETDAIDLLEFLEMLKSNKDKW